jgi:ubiquinone/menaquinone biosynthesis C-methylase UbiE
MSATSAGSARSENAETTEAWDGPLFDRFLQFKEVLTTGLAAFGTRALELEPPLPGQRVLDIGCGFGDATLEIAERVGQDGAVLGLDIAPRFVAASIDEAARAGARNVRFAVADVQTAALEGAFDMAFARFGTMFFANPVAAMRNIRHSLVPGGRLVMTVWRQKVENEWMYRAQQIVERFVTKPEEYDEPTCGPGPFSMAGADTTSGILLAAGYVDVAFRRVDLPVMIGRDLDEAVTLMMSLGPAGEIIRLSGERAVHLHGDIDAALRQGLGEYVERDGSVRAPASVWIVTASAP